MLLKIYVMVDTIPYELFGSTLSIIIFSAIIAGLMVRTGGKALDKFRDGEITKFDPKWLYTLGVAFVGSIIPALGLMAPATETFMAAAGNYGLIGGWVITAFMAYGINEGVNYTYKRLEGKVENNIMKSGKLDKLIEEKVEEKLQLRMGRQSETQS